MIKTKFSTKRVFSFCFTLSFCYNHSFLSSRDDAANVQVWNCAVLSCVLFAFDTINKNKFTFSLSFFLRYLFFSRFLISLFRIAVNSSVPSIFA